MRIIILILPFLITGCATMDSLSGIYRQPTKKKRMEYVQAHPDLDDKIRNAIAEGKVIWGMSKEHIRASWGEPCTVNTTRDKDTFLSQWVYGDYGPGIGGNTYQICTGNYFYFNAAGDMVSMDR